MNFLNYLFGPLARNILMDSGKERAIILEMSKIEGIKDYWELQRQAGYQLFARTKDDKYLGYSEMANTMLRLIDDINKKYDDEKEDDNGYDAEV